MSTLEIAQFLNCLHELAAIRGLLGTLSNILGGAFSENNDFQNGQNGQTFTVVVEKLVLTLQF